METMENEERAKQVQQEIIDTVNKLVAFTQKHDLNDFFSQKETTIISNFNLIEKFKDIEQGKYKEDLAKLNDKLSFILDIFEARESNSTDLQNTLSNN